MREIMLAATLLGAAALLTPGEAEAQTWRDQLGIPGDFRCDAYWDRGRDDCDAAWRTQYLRQDLHERSNLDVARQRLIELAGKIAMASSRK